jgi:NitT/TauT family transport system substrate-binding protein
MGLDSACLEGGCSCVSPVYPLYNGAITHCQSSYEIARRAERLKISKSAARAFFRAHAAPFPGEDRAAPLISGARCVAQLLRYSRPEPSDVHSQREIVMTRFGWFNHFAATCVAVATTLGCGASLAADKVSVRLNWVAGSEHGYFYLAKERGWYSAAGIELEILSGTGSTVSVSTVGAGTTDFALADGASVARGWEVGVPIVVAAVLLKESPGAVYSRKNAGITTLKDLCGKKVGVNLKSTTAVQYHAMLSTVDLKDCKIEEVPIAGGGTKEMLASAVDAAVGFSYEDPIMLRTRGLELNEIFTRDFFKLYSLGLITNQNMVKTKRDVVDRFMQVTMRALQYAVAHPDEALAAFVKVATEPNMEYEKAKLPVFNRWLTSDDPSGKSIGKQDAKGWQASLDTMQKLGIVKTKIDPAGKFIQN